MLMPILMLILVLRSTITTGGCRWMCTTFLRNTFAYGEVATRPSPSAPAAAHGHSAPTVVLRFLKFALGRSQRRDECSHNYGISMVWHGGRHMLAMDWRQSYKMELWFGAVFWLHLAQYGCCETTADVLCARHVQPARSSSWLILTWTPSD